MKLQEHTTRQLGLPSPETKSVCQSSVKMRTHTHLSVLHLILQQKQRLKGAAAVSWTPAAKYKTLHLHQTTSVQRLHCGCFGVHDSVMECTLISSTCLYSLCIMFHQDANYLTPFTSSCILPAPSMTSTSFKPDNPEACGSLGLLGRGPWHLAEWLLVVCSQSREGVLFQRQRRERFVEALKP